MGDDVLVGAWRQLFNPQAYLKTTEMDLRVVFLPGCFHIKPLIEQKAAVLPPLLDLTSASSVSRLYSIEKFSDLKWA